MEKIYKIIFLQYLILIVYCTDFSYSDKKASSNPIESNNALKSEKPKIISTAPLIPDAAAGSIPASERQDDEETDEETETILREMRASRDCGKRLIPEVRGSSQIRLQVPRIKPEFDTLTNVKNRMETHVQVNGAWPWMAGIYTRNFGIENVVSCGAAIIDQYHLVTAAHCFRRNSGTIEPYQYVVRVGSIKVLEGDLHLIAKITVHPDYNPRKHYNDIAVIRVKEPFQFEERSGLPNVKIQPICLPISPEFRKKKLEGRDVTVTGWGDQLFGGIRAATLQEITAKVIDQPTCDKAFAFTEHSVTTIPRDISNQRLCVGVSEGGKAFCQRDSGGPLMLLVNDVWVLVGVVSYDLRCYQAGFPSLYARITNYLDWIQEVTSAN